NGFPRKLSKVREAARPYATHTQRPSSRPARCWGAFFSESRRATHCAIAHLCDRSLGEPAGHFARRSPKKGTSLVNAPAQENNPCRQPRGTAPTDRSRLRVC